MINIVFATYNGQKTLPLMLEAFLKIEKPKAEWSMFVVDNNSTDNSVEIIKKYQKLIPIKLFSEKKPGKNNALNKALPELDGELIIFTDDDIIPDKNWLVELEKAAETNVDVSVIAGQVRHHWLKKPPRWLERLAADGRSYAGTPVGKVSGEVVPNEVKGANFLVRRNILEAFSFSGNVGPDGTSSYVAGSESDFLSKVANAGYKLSFAPDAIVLHIVRPNQVGIRPVLARYFRIGKGSQRRLAVHHQDELIQVATLLGFPRYLIRIALSNFFKAVLYFLKGSSYAAVNKLIDASYVAGRCFQWKELNSKD